MSDRADIVCRYCAHGKVWHRDEGECRAPEGPDWRCDCPAWDYGFYMASLPHEQVLSLGDDLEA